jgi:hypothetical protein
VTAIEDLGSTSFNAVRLRPAVSLFLAASRAHEPLRDREERRQLVEAMCRRKVIGLCHDVMPTRIAAEPEPLIEARDVSEVNFLPRIVCRNLVP